MRFLKISLLVVTAASTLHAQESKSKFGLGVTFNPGALTIPGETEILLTQSGFNNLLMPIRGSKATFEPEFGLLQSSVEQEIQTGPTPFTKVKTTASNKRIAFAALNTLG